jgi:putative spermidine/putrescine transport system substrate-binding protein
VQAYDGAIYIADGRLYLMAKKPELGIKDPYELNEQQYSAVTRPAAQAASARATLLARCQRAVQDFTNEGVVVSGSWPFQVNTLVANKQPIAEHDPEEGATGWADTTMLAANAKHPNCAYKWIEVVAEREGSGRRCRVVRLVPAVPAAVQGQRAADGRGLRANGFDNFDKIHFWRTRKPRARRHVRALQPLGDGLRRGDGRPLNAPRTGACAPHGCAHAPIAP